MCFAVFAWFAWAKLLAGIAKTATGKACNKCNTLGQLGLLRHKCSFPSAIFLILIARNSKRLPGIDSKTSDCLS